MYLRTGELYPHVILDYTYSISFLICFHLWRETSEAEANPFALSLSVYCVCMHPCVRSDSRGEENKNIVCNASSNRSSGQSESSPVPHSLYINVVRFQPSD